MWIVVFSVISFAISVISMPLIINFCKHFGLYDYQDARKIHSGNIPRIGGIGIVISFFISAVAFLMVNNELRLVHNLPLLIAGCIIFVFALLDDIYTFHASVKLTAQIAASFIVTIGGFRFSQIFGYHLPLVLSYGLTFCWILGAINAYNLIDGLDGLCGTLSATAVAVFGFLYLISNNQEAGICFILVSSILGFLVWNWPPAKLFMGDGGSQFLGFMIATIPFYSTGNETIEFNKFLIIIIITAFPVFDTIAAIWRRIRDGRPIMSADKSHLHHKLLNMGYSKTQALYLIAGIQMLLCIAVVLSYFLGKNKGLVLLIESLVFMVTFFSVIHYTNRAVNLKREKEEAEAGNREKQESGEQETESQIENNTENNPDDSSKN